MIHAKSEDEREAPEKFVNTKWGYPKEDEEK